MKSILLVACRGCVLAGCSVNGSTPVTAWGKPGVSMLDYRTDAGQCAVLAATRHTETDAAKHGRRHQRPEQRCADPAASGSAGGFSRSAAVPRAP